MAREKELPLFTGKFPWGWKKANLKQIRRAEEILLTIESFCAFQRSEDNSGSQPWLFQKIQLRPALQWHSAMKMRDSHFGTEINTFKLCTTDCTCLSRHLSTQSYFKVHDDFIFYCNIVYNTVHRLDTRRKKLILSTLHRCIETYMKNSLNHCRNP